MAQRAQWYSRIIVCFCVPGLMAAPAAAWGQLPDSPLRPSGQGPVTSPSSLTPPGLTPANLAPANLAPAPSASALNPLGPAVTGNYGPSGATPGGLLPPNATMQPVGGLQPHLQPHLQPQTQPETQPRMQTGAAVPNPSFENYGAMERGVVTFDDTAAMATGGNRGAEIQTVNYETEQTDSGLSPMEQRYSAWWREVLGSANVQGQGLELKSLLQSSNGTDRVPMIREYWRLSEAIVAVHVHRESLETWQRATAQQAQQPLARTLVEILNLQIEQANATVEAEQEHLGLWLQRLGLTQQPRPVDSPFLGLYDTKLNQIQQQGAMSTDVSVLAQQVEQRKQEVLDDEQVIDWADQEWERARTGGDLQRMATMIQLRQSAYLLWLSRVTRYNEAIAQYAFRVAGPNVPVPQQLAMLLRQPIVDGRLTDIRTDAWFRSAPASVGADFREIAPVSYNQPQFGLEPAGGVTGNWQPARGR